MDELWPRKRLMFCKQYFQLHNHISWLFAGEVLPLDSRATPRNTTWWISSIKWAIKTPGPSRIQVILILIQYRLITYLDTNIIRAYRGSNQLKFRVIIENHMTLTWAEDGFWSFWLNTKHYIYLFTSGSMCLQSMAKSYNRKLSYRL